jgi:GrpB-like predicted nucleotidyltransferase (UPF0157 family)
MRGKPVIDIQISVHEADRGKAIAALIALGYEHHGQGGVEGRDYLTRRDSAPPRFNIHVFSTASRLPEDNRSIRDYLRAHPEAAHKYAMAKQRAVEQGLTDLLTYSEAKSEAVAAIRDEAAAWSQPR